MTNVRPDPNVLSQESKQLFRLMADIAPVLIWVAGTDKLCTWFNKVWLDFTGRTIEQEMGNGWADVVHPNDLLRCLSIYTENFDLRQPFKIEHRLKRHDGEYRWVTNSGIARYADDGTFEGYIGSCIDTNEMHQIQSQLQTGHDLLDKLSQHVPGFIYQFKMTPDGQSSFPYASEGITEIYEVTPEQAREDAALVFAILHKDDYDRIVASIQESATSMQVWSLEYRVNLPKKGVRWLLGQSRPVKLEDGSILWHGYITDITERKKTEEAMHLAALVYEHSSEAMSVTDSTGAIVSVNPAFTEITGYTLEEVVGRNASLLSSGRHDREFYQAMWNGISTAGHWQGEIWNRRKNGEIYLEWIAINTIYNDDDSVHRYVALFSDITQKKESEQVIWQQANFDTLTGLPNRRMFYDRLEQEIKKSHRSGLPMALMLLDLDRFKEVNDTLGHAQGDVLLVEAARRIAECIRESDTVARLGGDEFTVILSEMEDTNRVERISQNIIERLAAPFQLLQETAYVSASVGITLYPNDALNIEVLMKNADQAMYLAKNSGRGRFSYFTAALQEAAQTRLGLLSDLRNALPGKQLMVYYQPIVEMASGKIYKAEALLRWQHPERGMVSPMQFIPLAEESGLIHEIGDWVFHETARQLVRLRELFVPELQISVNKSPVQFRQNRGDYESWPSHLHLMGLPGNSLVVEITEGVLLNAEINVTEKLLSFRDAGIQVSLDDFGTGYSSLSYLKKFDIDYLKIDQSFVCNLGDDPDDQALCEAIIVMAHKLGLKVIAEGVETPQQRDLLEAYGCDYGQGWLYSKAVPAEEFEALLKEQAK